MFTESSSPRGAQIPSRLFAELAMVGGLPIRNIMCILEAFELSSFATNTSNVLMKERANVKAP
jgi:hypothetical protein